MRSKRFTSRLFASTLIVLSLAIGIMAQDNESEHRTCSNATLHGSFGYTATGTLLVSAVPPPFAGPFAEVGRQTFDGNGNTEAIATLSANGNIAKVTIQGTYAVNPDCTGSMTLNVLPLNVTAHADFVIDNDGAELRTIGTDSGGVESRVYRKQFPRGRKE
jgi:hypothetical protein